MAKDLPYFKFFCSEWNDGDITLESYEAQGLFINICSYYWSNECNVPFDKLLKRFRSCEDIIDDLSAAQLFKIDEDRNVRISFLDEQRDERVERSKIRSKGGKASAEARKLKKLQQQANTNPTENQHVLNSCSTETQLLREEEIRKEEKREDVYTQNDFLERWKTARLHYDKKPTNISKLNTFEKMNFDNICKTYTPNQIDQAIAGMFQQKTYKATRLRPTHFLELEHFEKYLTCFTTKEKLYDDKFKKPIERI